MSDFSAAAPSAGDMNKSAVSTLDTADAHPCFSDYTHIPSVSNISFAAGLRQDDHDIQSILEKILPMTKFIPAIHMPRKKIEKKAVPVKIIHEYCDRMDCGVRKSRYNELKAENKPLRNQVMLTETKINMLKNKFALTEKAIKIAEDKCEKYSIEIDDYDARLEGIREEVTRADNNNKGQRDFLADINNEIVELRKQLVIYLNDINGVYANEHDKVKFTTNMKGSSKGGDGFKKKSMRIQLQKLSMQKKSSDNIVQSVRKLSNKHISDEASINYDNDSSDDER